MRALLAAAVVTCGCRGGTPAYGVASVDEVDRAITSYQWRPVDTNTDATRRRMGTLPGAVLLSAPEAFAASELPYDQNTELVFYCSDERCGSPQAAANRA